MKLIKIICKGVLLFSSWILFSCSKNDFLDVKPSTSLIVPETLEDFRMLLDNYNLLNNAGILTEISSNDFYLLNYSDWEALYLVQERNAYIWKKDLYEGQEKVEDWNAPYQQIFYANVVLEGLDKIQPTNNTQVEYNFLKGWALFVRAYALFNLSQAFAPVYDSSTATEDLGVPIRIKPGVDEPSIRSSVQENYDQILRDIATAKDLLPSTIQIPFSNRPCKAAAMALEARVYLNMRMYDNALESSESSLKSYNTLMDYNNLTGAFVAYSPFDRTNPETIYQCELSPSSSILSSFVSPNTIVDSILFASYSDDDLRKEHYFMFGQPKRKGSYTGTINPFGGLATDEVYLIKAECLARANKLTEAIETLNSLLITRWKTGTFIPYEPTTQTEGLNLVLQERRKELIFRGLRWQDLRRLNKEGANITLTRTLDGQTYTLPPNSPLYVLPIPPDEIRLSGIQQNPRH